jgi:hypothetical protein
MTGDDGEGTVSGGGFAAAAYLTFPIVTRHSDWSERSERNGGIC